MVLATLQLQIPAVKKTITTHIPDDDIIDTGVWLPVGRAYPYVWDVTDFLQNGLDIPIANIEIVNKEFIAAETNNDIGGLDLPNEMLQGVGLCPEL